MKENMGDSECSHVHYLLNKHRSTLNIEHGDSWLYGIHIFSSLKISNKNILKNILEI